MNLNEIEKDIEQLWKAFPNWEHTLKKMIERIRAADELAEEVGGLPCSWLEDWKGAMCLKALDEYRKLSEES